MAVTIDQVKKLVQDTGTPAMLDDDTYNLAIEIGISLFGSAAQAAQMIAAKFAGEATKQSLYQVGAREINRYDRYMEMHYRFTEMDGGGNLAMSSPEFDLGTTGTILPKGLEYDTTV